VNSVLPGFIADRSDRGAVAKPGPDDHAARLAETPIVRSALRGSSPLSSWFSESERASYVTGSVLEVDGGFHALDLLTVTQAFVQTAFTIRSRRTPRYIRVICRLPRRCDRRRCAGSFSHPRNTKPVTSHARRQHVRITTHQLHSLAAMAEICKPLLWSHVSDLRNDMSR